MCPIGVGLKTAILFVMDKTEVTDRLQDWQKRASETAKNWGKVSHRYVRENTWTTLALAAVLGCVIGYLLSADRD